MNEQLKNVDGIRLKELRTFDKFCQELGKDMDPDFCREIEDELQDCPECKVYYDTIKKTVQIYRICEEVEDLDHGREQRLFKVLDLEMPDEG